MKSEYENFRRNKQAMEQLEKDINMKEKERKMKLQQADSVKSDLDKTINIENTIAEIFELSEKLMKVKNERDEYAIKINNLKTIYPELKTFRPKSYVEDSKI